MLPPPVLAVRLCSFLWSRSSHRSTPHPLLFKTSVGLEHAPRGAESFWFRMEEACRDSRSAYCPHGACWFGTHATGLNWRRAVLAYSVRSMRPLASHEFGTPLRATTWPDTAIEIGRRATYLLWLGALCEPFAKPSAFDSNDLGINILWSEKRRRGRHIVRAGAGRRRDEPPTCA